MKTLRILLGASAAAFVAVSSASAQTKTVTLAAYSGIFQDHYTKAVIEPFMKAHPDIKVQFYAMPNSAQMLGTLRAQKAAPQIDVMIMDVSVSKAATDEGLFDKIDESVSKNVADLYPAARIEGVGGVAVTFDNLVLLYNKDQVKAAPTSWNALWDKQYAGKVAIPAVPDIQGTTLTIIANKMAGQDDYKKSVEPGIKKLGELAPNVQTWDPKPDVYTPIANGQAALGIGWNARAQVYSDTSGGKLGVVLPEEGSAFQINTINLVKNAPAGDAAKTFIDYALKPETQAAFTEAMFYAPTNKKAQEKIYKEALARTAAGAMDRMIAIDWIAVAGIRDAITEQWRRRVIPLSR
ncbi:ABC transporter substrate-binding protein [Microvirga thermotolerans]|uniref:Extracellular solute-binding protein n=1 Tax=Microvirga thermotolerans TaxID=2651334 RepID=A0A5P9K1I3_9HYPH|nr:ABC transporter substrate-binding protein [Microvirga thermotolerans]QFU16074.1 extracellular solute-binding protein [Microvirga thermotolerans]